MCFFVSLYLWSRRRKPPSLLLFLFLFLAPSCPWRLSFSFGTSGAIQFKNSEFKRPRPPTASLTACILRKAFLIVIPYLCQLEFFFSFISLFHLLESPRHHWDRAKGPKKQQTGVWCSITDGPVSCRFTDGGLTSSPRISRLGQSQPINVYLTSCGCGIESWLN